MKDVKRASFRFEAGIFEKFKEICQIQGFSQVKMLEKKMKEVIEEFEKGKKGKKGNE